jgi:hypothetical protein
MANHLPFLLAFLYLQAVAVAVLEPALLLVPAVPAAIEQVKAQVVAEQRQNLH